MELQQKTKTDTNGLIPPYGGELKNLIIKDKNLKNDLISKATYEFECSERNACDVELLMVGAFSPLEGFMDENNYNSVIKNNRKVIILKKLFLLTLIFGLYTPVNAEQYPIHKFTCPKTGGECNEEERAVVKLVNDKYWKMLSDRIKENKHYKYPWYFVYKDSRECKYTVGAKEDMPTHVVNMEWIEVDICKKTSKLLYRDGRYR